MTIVDYAPVIAVGAFALYSVVRQKIRAAAQPLRTQLAERGEELLGDPNLPKHLHRFVRYHLETAFNDRARLIFTIFAVPLFPIFVAIFQSEFFAFKRRFSIKNPDTQLLFDQVMKLHDRITFANHPLLMMLVEFEVVLFVPIPILAFSLIRGQVPENANTADVKTFLEAKEQAIRHRERVAA